MSIAHSTHSILGASSTADHVSMLEAISPCEQIAGREQQHTLSDEARIGDDRWYVSGLRAFNAESPEWDLTFGLDDVFRDIYEYSADRGTAVR